MILKLMVDNVNVETLPVDAVPSRGSTLVGRAGTYTVGDVLGQQVERFGVLGDEKDVVYISAIRAPKVPTMPAPPAPPKQPFGILPRLHSVKKLSDIPLFVRPEKCPCGQPHGMGAGGDDVFVVVESDRGILCRSCAAEKEPAMVRMIDDYAHFGIHSSDEYPESAIEIRAIKEISLDDLSNHLRVLADDIDTKNGKEKAA